MMQTISVVVRQLAARLTYVRQACKPLIYDYLPHECWPLQIRTSVQTRTFCDVLCKQLILYSKGLMMGSSSSSAQETQESTQLCDVRCHLQGSAIMLPAR